MSENSGQRQSNTRMSIEMGTFITAAFITRAREEVPLLSSTIDTKLEDREVSGAASPFSIMGGGLGVARQTPARG